LATRSQGNLGGHSEGSLPFGFHLKWLPMCWNGPMSKTVTISASYGALGNKIGRALADRLDLPFLDRALPALAAHQLAQSPEMAESLDEHVPRRWERIAMGFANVATPMGPDPLPSEVVQSPERFRKANEAALREIADTTGGVILGRAAMAVLGDRSDVLCVRLDGPIEARIRQVVAHGVDEDTARRGQREIDRARDAYAKVLFNSRQDDPALYHLMLDSTALSPDACVDIIIRAVDCRFGSEN
jgi:cytidylate kinase